MSPTVARFAAFAAGVAFTVGLAIAGMTLPNKVLGFLDVGGAWDPSLLLVMMGAIAVYASSRYIGRRLHRPLDAGTFATFSSQIDGRLLLGAAIFGAGWGLSGYCPGPAIAATAAGLGKAAAFTVAMVVGMWTTRKADAHLRHESA